MIRGSLYQFLNKLNETKREITRIRIKGIFKTKPLSRKLWDLRELNVLFFYNLEIFGVYGKIYGRAEIYDDAIVNGGIEVFKGGTVYGDAELYGNTKVTRKMISYGNALPYKIYITDETIQISNRLFRKTQWNILEDSTILQLCGLKL